jgi:hypothetical protein
MTLSLFEHGVGKRHSILLRRPDHRGSRTRNGGKYTHHARYLTRVLPRKIFHLGRFGGEYCLGACGEGDVQMRSPPILQVVLEHQAWEHPGLWSAV